MLYNWAYFNYSKAESTSFQICIVFEKFLRDRQCKPFFFLNIDVYFPLRGVHIRLPRIAVQNRKLILSWICRTCHRKLCFLYFSIMKSHLNNHLPFSFWLGVDREAQENYKDSLDDMKLYTTLLCNSRLLLKEETWSCFQIYLPRLPNFSCLSGKLISYSNQPLRDQQFCCYVELTIARLVAVLWI